MANQQIPSYFGLRIYLSSALLYFFLVFPFMIFLGLQNIPKLAGDHGRNFGESREAIDSMAAAIDTSGEFTHEDIDSLVNQAILLGISQADSVEEGTGRNGIISITPDEGEEKEMFEKKGPFNRYFTLLFLLTLLSLLVGLFYNLPFKRYIKRIRTKRKIPEKLYAYCKRHLLHTPVINALIIIFPNLVVIAYSLIFIISKNDFDGDVEKDLFIQFFYLTLVASLLEFMFAYYWQKHRVHIRYIEHIFTAEELRVQIFRKRGGKIRHRLLIASGMTTFLPLMVVTVYLILSITPIRELELEDLSHEQREILIGPWSSVLNQGQESIELEKYERFFYVNAGDSLMMVVGIGNGILVSFIYLLLFIRWTNQDITRPVKELLVNIRNTRGGEAEKYTIVRTNDEIGELAEGYNEMARKIHEHVEHISKMNRDLEKTVKERTQEVVMQKEEIEAQKEEIEAQLDLATVQRDMISSQKDQIIDSIRYAERIQAAILPPDEILTKSLADHFILFKPRDIVSGDYYWTTIKDGKLLVAVADCTGHGVPGAILSVLGISSMNEIISRYGTLHASEILEHLRNFVIHTLHQTGTRGEANDGIEIALLVIDQKKMTMEFAGANRPLYLVRSLSGDPGGAAHEFMHIKGDRMPIGIYEQEPAPFNTNQIPLEKHDAIYLFSDGYVDQLGGPGRKTFRAKRFRELLLGIQDKSMADQKQILDKAHESWRGEVEQIDDILVMGIRI